MQSIKLGFTDYYWPLDEFFMDVLSRRFNVIRDDKNPDFLIFCDETFGQNNLNYDPQKVVKVFFTGENRRPENYQADYFISFDFKYDVERHYRLPLYVLENWVQMHKMDLPDAFSPDFERLDGYRSVFCSFVVSNGGCAERNNMFHYLSNYKKVWSAGPLFNNTGFVLPREGTEAQRTKYNFLTKSKFNICYENSSYPGYVTEKLFHAFYAGCIPIYWGSPLVDQDFNEHAFVDRNKFNSDESMLAYIEEIDTNDELYKKMLSLPILNPSNTYVDLDRFANWFHDYVVTPE